MLVADDMDLARYTDPEHRRQTTRVRDRLVEYPQLVTVELADLVWPPSGTTAVTLLASCGASGARDDPFCRPVRCRHRQ